jgi:hypothetical protein
MKKTIRTLYQHHLIILEKVFLELHDFCRSIFLSHNRATNGGRVSKHAPMQNFQEPVYIFRQSFLKDWVRKNEILINFVVDKC